MENAENELTRRFAEARPPFAGWLQVELVSVSPDRVEAQIHVAEHLTNRAGGMHGGAIMAFADILGGMAARASLPPLTRTTTIESKTNFLRAIRPNQMAHGVCIPLHRGRTITVWQTTVSDGDLRPAAIVTQTQLNLPAE